MSKFTIADIPTIPPVTEDSSVTAPATVKDTLTVESPDIPQSSAPPAVMMDVFGENPWDIKDRAADEAEEKRVRDALAKIDGIALDPVSYFKDKDMGYTRDPEKTQRMAVNSAFMELASGDQPVPYGESDLQRRMIRQDIAIRRFGGGGADSEDAFHAEVVAEAQGRVDGKSLGNDLAKAANAAAFMTRVDLGETNASTSELTFRNWKEAAMKLPGYNRDNEADYFEAWHQVQDQVKATVDPFRQELDAVWKQFGGKGDFAKAAEKAYYTLPDDQHEAFMAALSLRAKALPEAEQAGFWANLSKQTGRDIQGFGQSALDALDMFTAGSAAMNAPEPAIIAQVGMERQSTDFRADVASIQQADYDPMKYLAKNGTWAQIFEKGAYAAPGAIVTSASAAIPGVGMAAFYLSSQESIYQQYRQDFQAKGMSYAEAASMATNLAPIAAVPQVLMERLQLKALGGKLPVFDKFLTGMLDKVGSRVARFGLRTAVGAVEQGSLEQLQDLVPAMVQDMGHALAQDVPDVQWTGKGGVLEGYWTKNAEMIVTMLPLAIFGAAGGISADRRATAFTNASTAELQALGVTAEGIAGINAAKGQASLNQAVDEAMATRDPESETAKVAVTELATKNQVTKQARENLEKLGYAPPSLVQSAAGVTVFAADGVELGTAPDLAGAMRISSTHTTALDNLKGDQLDALNSLFEATSKALELDPAATFDVALGEFDPAKATPGQAARFAAQVALKEQAEGGTGAIARSVLGYSVTSFAEGMRNTVNNLFGGGSIPTVFHETFHGLRRGAHEAGTVTRAMEISLLMGQDTHLGQRRVRDERGKQTGADLRFIPDGITAAMLETGEMPAAMIPAEFAGDGKRYADVLLDEGISEIAEVEVLKLRKGEGKGKLGITRELVSRNLAALAKLQPGVAGSWKAFFSAVRTHWGLATQRAVVMRMAERKGEYDPAEREAYLNKLLGLDAQVEHDAGVKDEFARMMAGFDDVEVDDIPFSIGRATVKPNAATQTFHGAEGSPTVIGPAAFSIGAYHGTPHKVDKFSLDKIGTGEGAQAYGWGLYFAEKESIARNYRDNLSGNYKRTGVFANPWNAPRRFGSGWIVETNNGRGHAVFPSKKKALEFKAQKDFEINEANENKPLGNLYTVTLDVNHEDLLDWDAPFGNQSEEVQGILKSIGAELPEWFHDDLMDNLNSEWSELSGRQILLSLQKIASEEALAGDESMGGDHAKEASEYFARKGIPGIRYLDGNSRTEGEGFYNYVMFDESKIQITHDNGKLIEQGEDAPFSLGPAQVAGILSDNALGRITDPRRRTYVMAKISKDFNAMRLQIDRIASLAGVRRSKGDMRREANAREDLAAEEKIAAIHQRFGSIMADEDLVKIKSQPVHAHLADPTTPLRGRLMSKAAAIKAHPERYQLHRGGEYDGSDGVSRSVFGGQNMPDQAAQELYDEGLISEPTADAMWEALLTEQKTVASMKELLAKATEQIREAKAEAKAEANEWLATQAKDQEVNFSDKEEIRRALRMLDAILLALPAEIRGKIGGYTQMSMINSDEARLAYLQDKLAKADKELETFLRVEYAKEWEALLAKAAPKTNEAGQRPTGSIAADAYEVFQVAEWAMGQSFSMGEAEADKWEAIADHPDTEIPESDLARVKAQMIRLTTNWTAADAARREQAVLEGDKIYFGGLRELAIDNSRRRERLGKLRTSAIDGTGKTGHRMEREATRQAEASKGGVFKKMSWEFLSFGQLVDVIFGEKSDVAKWFNERELAASNAKEDGFQAKADSLESLMETLSGSRFSGEKLRHRMSTEKSITATDVLGIDQTFTQSEAISFLLMWRQEDGRRHMEGVKSDTGKVTSTWGWNDASAASIEKQLSKEARAAMAFISASYGEEYGRINEVFRRIWNVSMPRHKLYAPLSVMPAEGSSKGIMDPQSGETMGAGMTPGSLKNRSFSAIAEPEFKDAFGIYLTHAKQMEHFIAYGEFSRDALGVINRRETRSAILAAGGPTAAGTLSKWIDYFTLGGVHDASVGSGWTATMGGMLGRISQAALVGRVSVLAMQSLQLAAASFKMPLGSFLTRFAKLSTGQLAWGDAMGSEYIQRRLGEMPPVVRDMMQGLSAGTPNYAKYTQRKLGKLIGGADALFTAGTYAIFYDYHLKLARDLKTPNPEAAAHKEAARLTDQVAQPTRTGARSWLEVANQGNPAFRAMWNFSSDPRQKAALLVYEAMRRDTSGWDKTGKVAFTTAKVWLVGGVLSTVMRAISRDLRNDDDDEIFDERYWNPKRLALMASTGPLGAVPFLGGMLEDTTYAATGQYMPRGGMLGFLGDAAAIPKKWSKGKVEPLKDLETLFTAGSGFSGTSAAGASGMHIIRDTVGFIENLEGPD